MSHPLLPVISCLAFLVLTACENYDFKVNERVVYSPAPLFTDYDTPDEALRSCLEQAIADNGIRAAGQLTTLNCSHAGIETVDGLATFSGTKMLKLSSNNIRNLVELGQLTLLEELYLDNNQVVDPVPLYQLNALRFVDLSGNPDLQCPRGAGFAKVDSVILPSHCR